MESPSCTVISLPASGHVAGDLAAWLERIVALLSSEGSLVEVPCGLPARNETGIQLPVLTVRSDGPHVELPDHQLSPHARGRLYPWTGADAAGAPTGTVRLAFRDLWGAYVRCWLAFKNPLLFAASEDAQDLDAQLHGSDFEPTGADGVLARFVGPRDDPATSSPAAVQRCIADWQQLSKLAPRTPVSVVCAGLSWAGSRKGPERSDSDSENDDQYFWATGPAHALAAVADGVSTSGGATAGFPAAWMSIDALRRARSDFAALASPEAAHGLVNRCFARAGERLRHVRSGRFGTKAADSRTAIALACVAGGHLYAASAGNVRVYHLHGQPAGTNWQYWPSRLFPDDDVPDVGLSLFLPLPRGTGCHFHASTLRAGDLVVLVSDGTYSATAPLAFPAVLAAAAEKCSAPWLGDAPTPLSSARSLAWQLVSASEPAGADNATALVLHCVG